MHPFPVASNLLVYMKNFSVYGIGEAMITGRRVFRAALGTAVAGAGVFPSTHGFGVLLRKPGKVNRQVRRKVACRRGRPKSAYANAGSSTTSVRMEFETRQFRSAL
jgi:hypothetical protein